MKFILKKFFKFISSKSAYTLIEVLVAMGIFLIVTAIAMGGFVRALSTNRESLNLMAANSNASAVIEQMTREIRTGSNFVINPDDSLSFDNAEGLFITYGFSGNQIIRDDGVDGNQNITDSNIFVEYLKFKSLLEGQNYPHRIQVNLGLRPRDSDPNSGLIHLQTSISSLNF